MLNILTDLIFGELREYLEDGIESFLWRILMKKKKKAHNVGSKGGFMYYLICVKMLLAFMLTRVEEVHHSLTLNLLYPCSHLSNTGLRV